MRDELLNRLLKDMCHAGIEKRHATGAGIQNAGA